MLPSRGKLPLKGVYRDSFLRKNPDGFTPDVMAMVVSKTTAAFNTEPGNELVFTNTNRTVLGTKDLIDGRKLQFSINTSTGLDEIGIINVDYTYDLRINQALGFDTNHPFTPNNIQVEYNFLGQLVVAFSDNFNSPKIINLDNPPSPFVLSQIQLFPSFTNVIIDSEVQENGGALPAGTYYPVFNYVNNDGTITAYGAVGNPVYIVPSNGTTFAQYQGSVGGQATTKSIQFNLTNVDTTYDKIQLSVIYKSNGQITSQQISQVNTGSSVSIVYTGSEQAVDIEVAQILVPPAFYNRIAHLTQVQGTLYGADVSESDPINLQKYASLITLQFKSELLTATTLQTSYKMNAQNNKKKGFSHEEVYAFYLVAKLKSGGWTQAVHIPGRPSTEIDGSLSGQENALNSSLLGQDPNLATDIAIDANSKYYQTRDTTRNYNTGTFTGDFGFWENEDEVYPTTDDFNSSEIGGLDLRGLKVRHFRFPSIRKCKAELYSSNTEYGKTQLDALSIVVTSFPTIPSDILSQIEGFEICYAKRSYANMTVAGQDIMLNGGRRQGDNPSTVLTNPIYTSSGNWSNTQSGSHGSDINNEYILPYNNWCRLHSFNLLLNKPAISPSYLSNQLLYTKHNINTNDVIQDDGNNYAYQIDYTNSGDVDCIALANEDEQLFAIKNYRYVPNNVLDGQVNNYRAEEFIFAQITNGNNRLGYSNNDMRLENPGIPPVNLTFEQTYLIGIMIYRKNIYNSFYAQSLATTGMYWTVGNLPSQIYGGDIFTSVYGFVTFSPRLLRDVPNSALPYSGAIDPTAGVKVVRAHICESTDNIGFRYEVIGDDTTKYYPFETIGGQLAWFLTMAVTTNPNNIAYDKDFSSVNDINPFIPINPYAIFESNHPWRIIRSVISTPTAQVSSWRTFLANDYFELRKDRGFITNIQGIDNDLLINLQTTVLKTRGNEQLDTSGIRAFVGSGDIFTRPPEELRTDSKGYGGCQNTFSCLLTPQGYFFVDVQARKVFLVSTKLTDITDGLYSYFFDNLRTTGDNPYLNTGITVAWDEEYKRLILCQLDINPFVWSYTPEKESWTCRSPYQPNLLFNDRTSLFSYKANNLYKHNATNKAKWYGTIYPSWVVAVIRELPPKRDPYEPRDPQASSIDSLFTGVNWKTEVLINGIKQENLTVNQLLIWNSYQSTGNVNIIPFDRTKDLEGNQGYNARTIKDRWIFNKFRDLVIDRTEAFIDDYSSIDANINSSKDFILKKRFADDFLAVKFLFSNELISTLQPDNFLTDIEAEHNPITR